MIQFEVIRWKNFLSTGNAFTEIKLNDTPNALIIGENGAGKSTILDALCFSLFGKPFRKINKPQLTNTVNNKDCVVEIEFKTNNKQYKIVRGIKPNIFEIWCEGVCLNQDSASKDYQDHLEKFILKMNYKSFTQIVILGSASFTPFMQLSPADRRIVIEDLLDIQIFSVMSSIVKQRWQTNKDLIERNRIELSSAESSKDYITKTLESLRKNNNDKLEVLHRQLEENEKTVKEIEGEIATLEEAREAVISQTTSIATLKAKHQKLIKLQSQIETKKDRFDKDIAFFEKNDDCPTCRQPIDTEFKTSKIDENKTEITTLDKGLVNLSNEIDKIITSINEIEVLLKKAENLRNEITGRKSRKSALISTLNDLEDSIEQIKNSDDLTMSSVDELSKVTERMQELIAEKTILTDEKKYIETATQLLKDGGIKTKIIKQYLPIINKHINAYLVKMGFFVNFNIDEQFEETIKSRYRDVFSYQNFSEGEKTRIDLALLFTWRAIAKLKNSVNCNLLILDEIFDGSLDTNGTDEFIKIMWSLTGDANVFVISHKQDQMFDKFKKVYKFEKRKNFSRLV